MFFRALPIQIWAWMSRRFDLLCCGIVILLGAPAFSLMSIAVIYDDSRFLTSFRNDPFLACFAPFKFEVAYWRPLGTLSMCAPLWTTPWIGLEAAFVFSKSLSVLLVLLAAVLAVLAVSKAKNLSGLPTTWLSACALAAAAILCSFSPIIAEPEMWWSDRFDALVMALLMGVMFRMRSCPMKAAKLGEVVIWGLALCLAKESGAWWAFLLSLLLWTSTTEKKWAAGFALALSIYLPIRSAVVKWWPSHKELVSGSMPEDWLFKTPVDLMWSFLESLGRQASMLAIPFYDMDPSHSERMGPSWIFFLGAAALVLIIAAWLHHLKDARRGSSSTWSAWCCAAFAMMVLGAAKSTITTYPGEMLSTQLAPARYLAPSAIVIWVLVASYLSTCRASKKSLSVLLVFTASALFCLPVGWQSRVDWSDGLLLKEAAVREGRPNSWSVGGLAIALVEHGEDARAQKIALDWIKKSGDTVPMCELWDIAEAGPERLPPDVALLIWKRRSIRNSCPDWIAGTKAARAANLVKR